MLLDAVDRIQAQWATERPDVDLGPLGVIGRISRAEALLYRKIADVLAVHNLQRGEFDLLAALRRAGSPHRLTVGALLGSTIVTSGAVTNRLNRLVTKGLVTRETDPDNRRSIFVTLTDKGLTAVDAAVISRAENERAQLSVLNPSEQQHLADLLRKLLVGLGDAVTETD